MAYIPRTNTNGMSDSPYYTVRTYTNPFPFYNGNCTWYAWGRTYELQPSKRPTLSTGNATTFWENSTGYERGQEPSLGAVMVWGTRYYEHPGHVAVVEEVRANGDVVASNSNWGGPYFFMSTHTKSSGYNNYDPNLYFKGFVYSYPSVPPVANPIISGVEVVVSDNNINAKATATGNGELLVQFIFNVYKDDKLLISSNNMIGTPTDSITREKAYKLDKGVYTFEVVAVGVSGLTSRQTQSFTVTKDLAVKDFIPIWLLWN